MTDIIIKDVIEVSFDIHRWRVFINMKTESGLVTYVADASLQSGDAIWFGTDLEHTEAESDAYGY